MIAVDTSALVAIALAEPERDLFKAAILGATKAAVSSVSALEFRMVVYGRRGPRGLVQAQALLDFPNVEIAYPGRAEMDAALAAFVLFGKGSGHPASLNFGDLFSYALAKVRGLPLLFKGNDFAKTDIVPVLRPN